MDRVQRGVAKRPSRGVGDGGDELDVEAPESPMNLLC